MKTDDTLLPRDTSRDCAARQLAALKKMDISERAEMTFQLSDNLRSIVVSGIRHRHQDYNQEQVTKALLRLTLDKDLFDKVFPGCEILP